MKQAIAVIRQTPLVVIAGAAMMVLGFALTVGVAHWNRPSPKAPPPPLPAPMAQVEVPPPPPPPLPPAAVVEAEPPAAPPPPAVVEAVEKPAWERFAVPPPVVAGRPMVAVIIDDMGVDRGRAWKMLALPGPLTISLMSYAADLDKLAAAARAHGDEVMMHVPMQPLESSLDPGPGVLSVDLTKAELNRRLTDDLGRFSGYVGINNHMGSRFTQDRPGMDQVMVELHRRGLLFIDSLTTGQSVGVAAARAAGVPTTARDVFLDNDADPAKIRRQLAQAEALARAHGTVVAIGHPRETTIAVLAEWLPGLDAKGLALVPVTTVVKARMARERPAAERADMAH